jgi:hypothetical protein
MQMHKIELDQLFGYVFAFIETHRADAHRSGNLTCRERTEIEQLAGGTLAGGQKIHIFRLLAEKPVALRYLGVLLRNNDRRERAF